MFALGSLILWESAVVAFLLLFYLLMSIRRIGPTEVGLVTKRFGWRRLGKDSPIAFEGEAGYQADLLMPGLRIKPWLMYSVRKYSWVQVPAGEIGVVIAQVGEPLPIGAKSAVYREEFGNFTDLRSFIRNGGQQGVQRPVLPPGALVPIHPVGFLVLTKNEVYGEPLAPELRAKAGRHSKLTPDAFGLAPEQLALVRIEPQVRANGATYDTVGIVTTYEGEPLHSGEIASRFRDFSDVEEVEKRGATDYEIIETLLKSKNQVHKSYQDFQAFLNHGGRVGLQHDPLLCGSYALNPFLLSVERVPMLCVKHAEVAVIRAYTGQVMEDTFGAEFKPGSLVRPGHRGLWQTPLRTGKYPLNTRCYEAEIVPTSTLNLNWTEAVSEAHPFGGMLQQIVAKSSEGFVFKIDAQVQIRVPDTEAPSVISRVGTMLNLVNEVQAAVGNYFRTTLQSMQATQFIETRQRIQVEGFEHIRTELASYKVELKGVFLQDVVLPEDLVKVLTHREIANQEIVTFQKQRLAQEERVAMENAKGTAEFQAELAKSKIAMEIKATNATARAEEGRAEAAYIRLINQRKGPRPNRSA